MDTVVTLTELFASTYDSYMSAWEAMAKVNPDTMDARYLLCINGTETNGYRVVALLAADVLSA